MMGMMTAVAEPGAAQTAEADAAAEAPGLEALYEATFPAVAGFVSRMGGSLEDARDVFHDALIIYQEAARKGRGRSIVSAEAYLVGIAKHLWLRNHKENSRTVSLTPFEHTLTIPDDYFPSVEMSRLLELLSTAGRMCMELLRAVYHRSRPMRDLARALGYPDAHSLSAQKYRCLEKVRDTVRRRTMSYEDFLA